MTERLDWAEPFRNVHILQTLTPPEADRLLARVERIELAEGEVLFREGDPRARLLLITKGRVELTRTDAYGQVRPVVTLVRGDLLGEG
ncbi:MAG: cyclic nucleotide-binding domain-containing protein, partial [Planctomycetes bacterium]|nr:cyclic nucleotide-binding domain-containing protein [Planctomycetota bacterium]